MPGLGEELRIERENRGISLDRLSAETKVNLRHFNALEHDRFHELPGGVFRRGILKAYLQALKLEEQAWMPRFDASVAENARARGLKTEADEEGWVTFASNVKKSRVRKREKNGLRWLGVLLFAGLLAAAGWALWRFELQSLLR